MDRPTDGQLGRKMNGQNDRQMNGQNDRQMNSQININRWTVRQTWTDGQTGKW